MKKLFIFAAVAATLAACSGTEELSSTQEVALQNENPVAFSIYTSRATTRAGVPKEITTTTLKEGAHAESGFGVFGYYSDGKTYAAANTNANFMYNQRVFWSSNEWKYEPVKYWPNEFGNAAISDDVDRLTFFSYAPWIQVDLNTGNPVGATENEKNITAVTGNNTPGDPIVKYVVDTNPTTSVDLLWGVAAQDYSTSWGSATATVAAGKPFIDLLKPNEPTGTGGSDSKVKFNLRHALSKLAVTIDYIADANTPAGQSKIIKKDSTRIYVREIKIGGFVMKGALNLNNTKANEPNWKAYDGLNELVYEDAVSFKDGRRDGKEGAVDGINENEKYLGLNSKIIENYAELDNGKFAAGKTDGVTNVAVNLFEGGAAGDPIYVIPTGQNIDIQIVYDVETINPKLPEKISDGLTSGLSIKNDIRKTSEKIFGTLTKMEAGKAYTIKLHLGMTSVKVDAEVKDWDDTTTAGDAILPANQPDAAPAPQNTNEAIEAAAAYQYDPAYTRNGSWDPIESTATEPATLSYTYLPTPAEENALPISDPTNIPPIIYEAGSDDNMCGKIMNDFARMLGALYRAGGITEISWNSNSYEWNDNLTLIGSRWENTSSHETLVYDFAHNQALLTTLLTSGFYETEIETNLGKIKVTIQILLP